jgi:hypothetical protein
MIDHTRIGQFEESVGFVHLLQVCLQESSCYNTPKHDKIGAIAGSMGLRGSNGSVDDGGF